MFANRFELSDGQKRKEAGFFKDGVDEHGKPTKMLVTHGSYSHIAPGNCCSCSSITI